MIMGRYYSTVLSGCANEEDLVETLRTATGNASLLPKKLTLITVADIKVDINGLGVYSDLYLDSDSNYKLSLDAQDVVISSFIVETATVSDIFIAVVF